MPISTLQTRSPTVFADSAAAKLQHMQHQVQQHARQSLKASPTRHPTRSLAAGPALRQPSRPAVAVAPPSARMPLWGARASSNAELVDHLCESGVVRSPAVAAAMRATDRAAFLPEPASPDGASYADSPSPIGFGQTISAPHMHAHALELCYDAIRDVEQPRILDVGAGSGYLTACFARLAPRARVSGVELVPSLAQLARENVQRAAPELAAAGAAAVHCANGWDGLAADAPFHFIHVGAAASAPPPALLEQLADGGRLVIPLDQERGGQVLTEITRRGAAFAQRQLMGVCYVPLARSRRASV